MRKIVVASIKVEGRKDDGVVWLEAQPEEARFQRRLQSEKEKQQARSSI